jgi:uncharacterized membrane protein (DUF485 family)
MQRIIGVILGAFVTYLLLILPVTSWFTDDQNTIYLTAVVVGAIVSALWPWVIGLILVRRAKARRDESIQEEVERQMAAKG